MTGSLQTKRGMIYADIKMTANIYGHLDVARKKGIATAMSEKLASSAVAAS